VYASNIRVKLISFPGSHIQKRTHFGLLTVLLTVTLFYTHTTAFTVFDCQHTQTIKTYARLYQQTCSDSLKPSDRISRTEATVLQVPFSYKIPAKTLTVAVKTESFYCSYWRNNIQKIKSQNYVGFENRILPAAVGKHAIATRTLQLKNTEVELTLGTKRTVIDSQSVDQNHFCINYQTHFEIDIYEISYNTAEVTVELDHRGAVTRYKLFDDTISIEDLESGYLRDGTFIKFDDRDIRDCPLDILHSGVMTRYKNTQSESGSEYIVDTESGFGFQTRSNIILCGFSMTATNDKRVYILPGVHPISNNTFYTPTDVSWRSFILSTSQFISVQSTQNINTLKNALQKQDCILDATVKSILLNSADLHPTNVAYEITGERGMTITLAGAAFHILKCTEREAILRQQANCTTDIPILLTETNTSAFMDADTHTIRFSSTAINCHDMANPIFQIRDVWYQMSPNLHSVESLYGFRSGTITTPDFNTTTIEGLYDSELTDRNEPSNILSEIRHKLRSTTHIAVDDSQDIINRDVTRKTVVTNKTVPYPSFFFSLDALTLLWCALITAYLVFLQRRNHVVNTPPISVEVNTAVKADDVADA